MNRRIGALHITVCLATTLFAAGAAEPDLPARVQRLEEQLAALQEYGEPDRRLSAQWRNGPRLASGDGAFDLRVRARLQLDTATFFGEDDVNAYLRSRAAEGEVPPQVEDGAEIRRARLGLQGRLYTRVEFKLVYDFAGGDAEPKDVYLGLTGLPLLGTVRAGHQREPFSRLQGSSAYYVFMEKGLQNALTESRDLGIRLINGARDERLHWSAGAYRATDLEGRTVDEDAYSLTARVTGLPWYRDDGNAFAHLGLAYSYRRPPDDAVRFNTRPTSHLAESTTGLSRIPADRVDLVGTEAALVYGPFSVVGEYLRAQVDARDAPNETDDGYYVYASYLLTGETRAYSRSRGSFSRLTPHRNFDGQGGWGAWEIAARYSTLDLAEDGIRDMSGALNWYLNPVTRVMLNYVYADAEQAGDLHMVLTRIQLDF